MPILLDHKPAALNTFARGGNRRGYKKCKTCGVAPYVTAATLLKVLQRGLKSQRLEIVSIAKPGEPEGTRLGLLFPLFKLLRDKGFKVK